MTLNPVTAKLGRKIRLGIIGGGEGSLIGGAHRAAIQFDGNFEVVAAVLSRDPAKAKEQGQGLAIERPYGTMEDLCGGERSHPRPIDAVAIMTPNDSHVPLAMAALESGFHVICDKPVANSSAEALTLKRRVSSTGLIFCVTHNYSGYPMIRQAREMITAGAIGNIHLVELRYLQGNLGTLVEAHPEKMVKQLVWRLDPQQGGVDHLLLDIGTHAHQLVSYVLSRRFLDVSADLSAIDPKRTFADTALVTAQIEGGVRASLFVTKAATGAPHIFGIQIYGDLGGLAWEQATPQILQHFQPGKPTEIIHRGVNSLAPLARRSIRIPEPHPEGFREAFANIYADFAELVASHIMEVEPDLLATTMPDLNDGIDGLYFVEACAESNKRKSRVNMPREEGVRTA